MGQAPITIRMRVVKPSVAHEEHVFLGVSEAARSLNVSERTVYRMLKSGELEREDGRKITDNGGRNVSVLKREANVVFSHNNVEIMPNMSDIDGMNKTKQAETSSEILKLQIEEKDGQIAQLLSEQKELTRTVQRLQEQMYELAYLVLTHNAAAAQAKAEAELKAQEVRARQRGGLAGLLGNKGRK